MRTDLPDEVAISPSNENPEVVFRGFRDRRHVEIFARELAEILWSSGLWGDPWLADVLFFEDLPRDEMEVVVRANPNLSEEMRAAVVYLVTAPLFAVEYAKKSPFNDVWIVAYTSVEKAGMKTAESEMNFLVAFGAQTWHFHMLVPVAPLATCKDIVKRMQCLLTVVPKHYLPKIILTENIPPFFVDGRSMIRPLLDELGIEHRVCSGKMREELRRNLQHFRKYMLKRFFSRERSFA